MNLLQLVNRAVMESGVTGTSFSNTTVQNATGELLRFTTWINQAWQDLQNEHDGAWNWMRSDFSFTTVAQQAEYPYASAPLSLTTFGSWNTDTFRIYKDSINNETYLPYLEYRHFRDQFLLGSLRTSYSYPSRFTVSPTQSIILALPPEDTSYVVSGQYQITPTTLSADADIPGMPVRFHMLIVWGALIAGGWYENAPEMLARGTKEYKKLKAALEHNQLPAVAVSRGFL
jgi:hypothetical protein